MKTKSSLTLDRNTLKMDDPMRDFAKITTLLILVQLF